MVVTERMSYLEGSNETLEEAFQMRNFDDFSCSEGSFNGSLFFSIDF